MTTAECGQQVRWLEFKEAHADMLWANLMADEQTSPPYCRGFYHAALRAVRAEFEAAEAVRAVLLTRDTPLSEWKFPWDDHDYG